MSVSALSSASSVSKASTARRPRGIVKINGQVVSFLHASVDNKSHFAADTWQVKLEAWNQPEGFNMAYWADATDVQVEILFGNLADGADVGAAPDDTTSIILGQVDDVEINPFESDSLTISGRDLAAQLIDKKTTNKYPDHVSSWIVTTIAQQFKLTPQVTTTSTPVGQYYNGAYSSLARSISYWDLLVYLAQQEGFDLYVRGTTLYFGPPQADSDTNPLTISVTRNGNIVTSNANRLKLHRSLTLAQTVNVTVLSSNAATGQSIKAVASRAGAQDDSDSGSGQAIGNAASKAANGKSGAPETAQEYTISKPNLSQQQAQDMANRILVDVTRFERTIDVTIEGDPLLTVQNRVVIQGTGSSFDMSYYIQQITRSFNLEGGFAMHIQGKNTSTEANAAK